jgi:hypothetical protein
MRRRRLPAAADDDAAAIESSRREPERFTSCLTGTPRISTATWPGALAARLPMTWSPRRSWPLSPSGTGRGDDDRLHAAAAGVVGTTEQVIVARHRRIPTGGNPYPMGGQFRAVYDDARFEMDRHNQSTWQTVVDHGLEQGLRPKWLDFPTGDSAGHTRLTAGAGTRRARASSSRTSGSAGRLPVVPASRECRWSCLLAHVRGRCCTSAPYGRRFVTVLSRLGKPLGMLVSSGKRRRLAGG